MRRLAFLLRPGWIALALVVIAFTYLCFMVLAPWQLGKNTRTSRENQQIESSLNTPPVPVKTLLPQRDSSAPGAQWRRVMATGHYLPDVQVLARLRVGYALGAPELLARLTARRAHWPVGTLQLAAIAACCDPRAVAEAAAGALRLTPLRAEMVAGLESVGAAVVDGRAPFVLFRRPDAASLRNALERKGIALRRCDTFVGLDERYLRAAVRPEWPLLVDAIAGVAR